MTQFYEVPTNELKFATFDIETTGFKAAEDDYVTVVVMHYKGTYHIWVNVNQKVDAEEMYSEVSDRSPFDNFVIHICESERSLLKNLRDFVDSEFDDKTILSAFNGETYSGRTDFDLPFLRTRCARNFTDWVFDGVWYTDSYEVLSQKSRFDTTIPAEPSLDDMKKTDVESFADMRFGNISYESMNKSDIVNELRHRVAFGDFKDWYDNKFDREIDDFDDAYASHLKQFVDDNNTDVDFIYTKHSKDELIEEIRNQDEYSKEMLVEWHEQTGRSIGTTEATTLDAIHEVIFEDRMDDEQLLENAPFDLEVFEPFDPYISSGEAVSDYKNDEYVGVILHCFADVARTVNITRAMKEYVSRNDYKPKTL